MSMNIYIGTDESGWYPVLQTPTSVTYQILKSADPAKAYLEWVLSVVPGDGYYRDHAKEFAKWVKTAKLRGEKIVAEAG